MLFSSSRQVALATYHAAVERWPKTPKSRRSTSSGQTRARSCTRRIPARAWRSFPCSLDRSRRLWAQHCLFLGRGLCATSEISCARPGDTSDARSRSNRTDARSAIAHLPAPSAPSVGYTRGRLEERARQAREWRPASTMRPPLRLRHRDPLQCRSPVARAQG